MDGPVNPIRIAIADDDAGMRLVMRKIIEKSGEYELVGEATNGEEMLELFEREHPQAVILDVEMPVMDGIQCARAIQDRAPLTVIVFATGHEQYMGSFQGGARVENAGADQHAAERREGAGGSEEAGCAASRA